MDTLTARFNITEQAHSELIGISLEIVGHHVTDLCMETGDIVSEMKNRTMGMTTDDQVFVAYSVGGIISSIMEKAEQGYLMTDILKSMITLMEEEGK